MQGLKLLLNLWSFISLHSTSSKIIKNSDLIVLSLQLRKSYMEITIMKKKRLIVHNKKIID